MKFALAERLTMRMPSKSREHVCSRILKQRFPKVSDIFCGSLPGNDLQFTVLGDLSPKDTDRVMEADMSRYLGSGKASNTSLRRTPSKVAALKQSSASRKSSGVFQRHSL